LTAIQSALEQTSSLTEATIQDIIQQGVKSANVKKGLVMRSLRAALTGDMQGPDLVQSWLLLHQRQFDINRLKQALTVAETIAG
jgi:glutamyl-tRNA synthetase